jgi:hypothetical protein
MRYLHKREDFLYQKNSISIENSKNLNEQIKNSSIINETFENDVTWGGSMVGRLINSTIRRLKIGYSQTQVGPLIKKLEDELNYLLSASLQGDILRKYNELMIRQYIEEIRNICLSNQSDQDKLNDLLGQSTGLYDPNDPTRNQRTMGVVQEALDFITDDLKDLEKLFGDDRNKLIDKLSDFNDDLRKLTVQSGTPVQSSQAGNVSDFSLNFLNTVDAIRKQAGLVTTSFHFDQGFLNNYQLFTEMRLQENEQAVSANTTTDVKTTQQKQVGVVDKKEVDKVVNLAKTKKDDELKKNPEIIKFIQDISAKLPKDKISKIKVNYDGKEILLSDAISKLQSEITAKESNNYVFETNGGGMTGQPGGTASGTPGTTGGTSPKKVEDVWNEYEFDKTKGITRLTQREVDELNSLLTSGTQNLRYEPAKRPDPIVSIARIFGEAHQLYFTEVIPSGRPNGRVSQKTFREYYKLGTTPAKWEEGQAPEGPFAVKSIFNKWKTGVEKLLMNQEYRKILANVNFVVPGAEDKFNDNFNTKVFEAEKEVEISKTASQGQILFDFMNSMLDKKKLDDFDTLRSNLMSKYFGINLTAKDKKVESTRPDTQPTKDNFEANVAYFTSLQDPKIDLSKAIFYAIPIKKFTDANAKDHSMIFLQAIKKMDVKKEKDTLLVKFTYDEPIIMKTYHDKKIPTTKYVDWSMVKVSTQSLYYGLIDINKLNISNGKKIKIVYGNVNKQEVSDVYERTFEVSEGDRNLASGDTVNIKSSKFVYNDATAVKDIKGTEFEIKISTYDKADHNENLNKNVKTKSKKLVEVLKEQIKNSLP